MNTNSRRLGIVTGASAGIGYHLAALCAKNGFDLVVAADELAIAQAARAFETHGGTAEAVEVDLATIEGVDQLLAKGADRRLPRCSPTPRMVWAKPFSIRTSTPSATSSTRTSPAQFISFKKSAATCAREARVVIKYSVEVEGLPVYSETYDVDTLAKELKKDEAKAVEIWSRRIKCVAACRDRAGFSSCLTRCLSDGSACECGHRDCEQV